MAAARILVGRMGLALGMLLGLGMGALWWAGHAGAVPAPDATYTAVTPCVVFDSRASQGATGAFVGPLNGGQAVTYKVAGPVGTAQGGGNTNCGVPVGATSVEINVVSVSALNEGNLRVTDGAASSTGGLVNYNAMSPKLNSANAVIVPVNASGRLVVTPNCGGGCTADTTDVRGVVLGYFSTALAQRVAVLETLLTGVTRTAHNGYDTLQFEHVNVHLVNGTNDTYAGNGHGNLIFGYDVNSFNLPRTGSHDIVVGDDHGWSGSGGVIFGFSNEITESTASVTGGFSNHAGEQYSSITGGAFNRTSGQGSSVTGGSSNSAVGPLSSITGGSDNQASGYSSVVSGGADGSVVSPDDWRAGELFQED